MRSRSRVLRCAENDINVTVTAGGRGQLRALPVSRLRSYIKAYGLPTPPNVLEKDDIVDAVLAARVIKVVHDVVTMIF